MEIECEVLLKGGVQREEMTEGRKREEERGREEGEGKEAETYLPQWGKKRKREKGKGG